MRLIISEKNIAARRIAEILAVGKVESDKVYTTPVYKFRRDGEDWVSIGLKGHIMKVDFEEGWSKWRLDELEGLVQADVVKQPAEKGIIRSLHNLAKKTDYVYIATDYDREGELIGADARDLVREMNPTAEIVRARFSAITKDEIESAFTSPGTLSEELAQAGASRQDIDLVWGAVMTRYLTLASNKASKRAWGDVLSAGRVQTPTLKLIVDRETERKAFVPETYWTVKGTFSKESTEFPAQHATARFTSEADASAAMDAISSADEGVVTSVETNRRTVKPPAPFNTTALLAAAASEGLPPARTMRIAESLYMDGLLSYPRVDNTVYPASLDIHSILKTLDHVPTYHEHVQRLLAKGKLTPTRGKKEATDHPPIHPTGAADPEKLKPEQFKLYNLVARRFLATLSDPAVLESTKVSFDVSGQPFVARGDVVIAAGYRAVYPYGLKKEEHLPALSQDEHVAFLGPQMDEKQTQPPARFSQGKLIQEMEKLGLGTKATRHDIIQTLYDRKYAVNDPIEPTCKGETVVSALVAHADRITSPEMTRELDHEMDEIAGARATREAVVTHSRDLLADVMNALLERVPEVGETLKVAADEDAKVGKCPTSGDDLLIKYSPKTKSYFVGCSGYPDCSVTYPLPKNSKFAAVEEMCPECGSPQVKVMKFRSRARVMCLSPDCITKKGPELTVGKCPVDGADLKVHYSPVGSRYVRCVNYDSKEHAVSYPLPQNGDLEATDEICEPCGSPRVIVHTKKGPWKICIDPDCSTKEKKAPAAKGKAKPKAKPKSAAKKPKGGGRSSAK